MSVSAETHHMAASVDAALWPDLPEPTDRIDARKSASVVSVAQTPSATVRSEAWLRMLEGRALISWGRAAYLLFFKRAFDVLVASVLLLLFLPVLIIVALAIRFDSPGPVIFRQQRIGHGGMTFWIYKFRTMRHKPGQEFQLFEEDGQVRHKIKHDPRVTRLGRLIRRTSVDELPQLLNVLRGQMSLVGPRPELPEIVQNYEDWQHKRHLVRPGLTGWWQVQGRSDLPMHEHTELDLYYVENMSWRLDLQILRRTVRIVTRGFGAY